MKRAAPRRKVFARIVVTPLVDVVLVLLVLFLVLTPLLVRSIDVREPHSTVNVSQAEIPASQVVVSVRADGAMWLGTDPIDPEELTSQLQRRFAGMETRVVFFQGDPDLGYGEVVRYLDLIRASGAEILALAPDVRPYEVEATPAVAPTGE